MAAALVLRCWHQTCRYALIRSFPRCKGAWLVNKRVWQHFPAKNVGRCASSWSSLSKRDFAHVEDRLVTAVASRVQDDILQSNLKSLGWIQRRLGINEDGSIQLHLRLPTLLHPELERLKRDVEEAAEEQLQVICREQGIEHEPTHVQVTVSAAAPIPIVARRTDEHDEVVRKLGPGLSHVAHFLAVYSCKGGVGKSTIAVNLAYELARMGGRVGLLDVDIYGPSLPTLVHPDDASVKRSTLGRGMVLPITHNDVKLLSLGFVSPQSGVPGSGPDGGAAVMRGPMAGRVVAQLLKGTDWGELDVLVLDLPPGTGDVQLAVCQDLELSGAVAVTTPSKLAATDARKGIEMFTSLGGPTLAVVENMSYFVCEGGGRHYPFGKGTTFVEDIAFKSSNVFQLPISTLTNNANDSGTPLCLSRPREALDELQVFEELARAVSKELLLIQHGRSDNSGGVDEPASVVFADGEERFDVATTTLSLDASNHGFLVRLFSDSGATQLSMSASELRSRHPKTGEQLDLQVEGEEKSSDGGIVQHTKAGAPRLMPAKIEKKGRYGYSVEWADGATIIYSMLSIAKAAGGLVTR